MYSFCKILCYGIFIIVYCLPIKLVEDITSIRIDNLFFVVLFLYLLIISYKYKKWKILDFIFFIFVLIFVLIKKDILYFHLISILLGNIVIEQYLYIKKFFLNKNAYFIISLIGIAFFSLIYIGMENRYLFTGLGEANEASYAILILGIIVRKKKKTLSNFIFILGFLTFSKSYLLGLLIYFIVPILFKNIKKKSKLLKVISFKNCTIFSILMLIVLSNIYTYGLKNNLIKNYAESGIERYLTIYDYSNYYRFTVNTNLIEMYIEQPSFLLTGIEDNSFYKLSFQISMNNNQYYRAIKPHNYFFSYLQIYGIWSLFIFYYINKLLKKLICYENLHIFLVIFSYITFLGIGLTSYWLFISMFSLIIYIPNRKDT